jgi:thymidylate synthase (FAD)
MQGTLRSWVHYIALRASEDTQLEHRRIAIACKEVFKQQFPAIAEAAFE